MKIVHILPALLKGGGERAAVDLANYQTRQRHEVVMIVGHFADETLLRNDLYPSIEVRYVSRSSWRLFAYFALTPWLWKQRGWLSEFAVVHAHLTFSAFAAMLMRIIFFGCACRPAIVETYHAVGMPIGGTMRAIHRWLLTGRDAVALMAEEPAWRNFDWGRVPIRIIPNGLAEKPLTSAAKGEATALIRQLALAEDALVMGTVGRLVSERLPDVFLKIFALVSEASGPEVEFIFAGDGPERKALLEWTRASNMTDRIHFSGLAVDPNAPLELMDLYLTLAVGPIVGLAAVQAAFRGVPVIALQLDESYVTCADDWVWSDVNPGRIAEYATELLQDQAKRENMGFRQQKYVNEFLTIGVMAEQYTDLYELGLRHKDGRFTG